MAFKPTDEEAENGEWAIEKLRRELWDVVLLDLMLPIEITHDNRAFAAPIHTLAEATIDITHINRAVAEPLSHARRGHG